MENEVARSVVRIGEIGSEDWKVRRRDRSEDWRVILSNFLEQGGEGRDRE